VKNKPSQTRRERRRALASRAKPKPQAGSKPFRMFLVPCSCGTTFAVAENYDHRGTAWSCYLTCPGCGKKHDPKNRLLQMGFHAEGYWKVDEC
jgi:hypothetical protein